MNIVIPYIADLYVESALTACEVRSGSDNKIIASVFFITAFTVNSQPVKSMGYGDKRRVFRVGERLTVEHNMTECPAVPIGGDSHAAAILWKHYMVRIRFDLRIDSRQTRGLTTDHRLRDRAVDKLYTGITGLYFQIRRNGCKFQCLIGIFDRQPFLLKGKRSRRRQIELHIYALWLSLKVT